MLLYALFAKALDKVQEGGRRRYKTDAGLKGGERKTIVFLGELFILKRDKHKGGFFK